MQSNRFYQFFLLTMLTSASFEVLAQRPQLCGADNCNHGSKDREEREKNW